MAAAIRKPPAGSPPGALAARCPHPPPREGGFTLVEVLIAASILVIGVLAMFGLLDSSARTIATTRERETATNLARNILEDAHSISYAQLSPTDVQEKLQAMTGLEDGSSTSGWQIVRNGTTYTITASECSIDDGKDGWGKHVSNGENPFCKDPGEEEYKGAAGEKEDAQPADLKRITVKVKWTARNLTHEVQQVGTETAAGSAIGPSASGLKLTSPSVKKPTEPFISSKAITELKFSVTAPSETKNVLWSLEGSKQGSATYESGTTWTFSWAISGVSDGVYKVSAQAVNSSDVVGPPVSISVTLIRNVPAAPTGLVGGFDTVLVEGKSKKVVDMRWTANTERNVIGYRVYRPTSSGKELACPSSLSTFSTSVTCTDFEPPSPSASNRTYEVVALYHPYCEAEEALCSTVSESAAGKLAVTGEPLPSAPPTPKELKAKKEPDGSVKLEWTKSEGASFYRIYRGSKEYSGRYDFTGSGSTLTYTDTDATEEHSYWVTAVGSTFVESEPVGPVTK